MQIYKKKSLFQNKTIYIRIIYLFTMTYQNILNNNVRSIDCKLLEDEYFDYMLYKGEVYGSNNISEMTIANFSCPFLIENGVLYSTSTWVDAKNNGVLLEDIGFTGPDNGFISFRKDRISNKDNSSCIQAF